MQGEMRNKIGRPVLDLTLHGEGLRVDAEAWGMRASQLLIPGKTQKGFTKKGNVVLSTFFEL